MNLAILQQRLCWHLDNPTTQRWRGLASECEGRRGGSSSSSSERATIMEGDGRYLIIVIIVLDQSQRDSYMQRFRSENIQTIISMCRPVLIRRAQNPHKKKIFKETVGSRFLGLVFFRESAYPGLLVLELRQFWLFFSYSRRYSKRKRISGVWGSAHSI